MIAAFFDIDGTLYRGSLMIEHFKKLIRYEVIDPTIWFGRVKDLYDLYEKRQGEYDDYMEQLAGGYIKSLTGINLRDLEFIADQVINLKGDAVYKYSRNQINYHLRSGHKVFFISGSPDFLVEKMAKKYGVSEYVGSGYVLDEFGIFTGKVERMWDSESKLKAIESLIEKYKIDPSDSYAYGDTRGDISMLKLVGNPVAINPTYELISYIRSNSEINNKAKIIVERKDVIYEINNDLTKVHDFRME
jgi:HAD superfamily hydrolase (TIGR01490 family)